MQRSATMLRNTAIGLGLIVALWVMPSSAAAFKQEACSAVAQSARGVCNAYCRALDCPDGHHGAACEALRNVWQKRTGSSLFPCDQGVVPTITCEPVAATETHGDGLFVGNLQLGRVVDGKIPCAHNETAELAECVFDPDHLDWLEGPSGIYVVMGQATSLSGLPGEFVTAGQVSAEGTVSCIEPPAGDSTGLASSIPLSGGCQPEILLIAHNASGFPLENFANIEVCSTDQVHPDAHAGGPDNTRCFLNQQTGLPNCCWIGEGAALNDRGGRERNSHDVYLPEPHHCTCTSQAQGSRSSSASGPLFRPPAQSSGDPRPHWTSSRTPAGLRCPDANPWNFRDCTYRDGYPGAMRVSHGSRTARCPVSIRQRSSSRSATSQPTAPTSTTVAPGSTVRQALTL